MHCTWNMNLFNTPVIPNVTCLDFPLRPHLYQMTKDTSLSDCVLFLSVFNLQPKAARQPSAFNYRNQTSTGPNIWSHTLECGWGSVVRIATRLSGGRSVVWIPAGASPKRPDDLCSKAKLQVNVYRVFTKCNHTVTKVMFRWSTLLLCIRDLSGFKLGLVPQIKPRPLPSIS
jgi:hypothetical protein